MKFDNQMQEDIQMSEAFITSVFLALSGGFQDAYTYFTRNEVFSNAQTGNRRTHEYAPDGRRMDGCTALPVSVAGICRRRIFCRAYPYVV